MSMKGGSRRGRAGTEVRPERFSWDAALIATLRHSSLPFGESLPAVPLAETRNLGMRDRLSLLAQFAAHQALLQFAGIADDDVDASEWAVVAKRGSDARLVRIAARACDPSVAPPVLTLAQQFAELAGGAELDILRQSWARADAIYAEAFARLAKDVAADLQWMQAAACGAIRTPGPEALRMLANDAGRYGYSDPECLDSVSAFAERVIVLRGVSPLARYSALPIHDRNVTPEAAAERILAATSRARHIFIVANAEAFDDGSRAVVELLANAGHGTWLMPEDANALPETRWFVVAPRLAAREALPPGPYDAFVRSDAFGVYLASGEVPARASALPNIAEPARSYIGALALLGERIPRDTAQRFLAGFLFRGELDELVVEGVTSIDGNDFLIHGNDVAAVIPAASRATIARVAAVHATGVRAALLWLDAGDADRAVQALEESAETVEALHRIPVSILTPKLRSRYAHALIDRGRYRDARDLAAGDELVLARAERRMGDYATALARLDRVEPSFDALLLRAELLRLLDRDGEAREALARCEPRSHEECTRLDYERGLHGEDVTLPEEHYFAARLATYRGDAAKFARISRSRARTTGEAIDAWLDLVFATFSAGQWDEARAYAVAALRDVEETQGDRAAGGILFTLAYLAADDGQWTHAAQRIARLRQYYTANHDPLRLAELQLLTAHLDFSRGRFADARRAANAVVSERHFHDQIEEAAALILDELDWMEGRRGVLRSTGKSGNAELTRRRATIGVAEPVETVPQKLRAFRRAVAAKDHATARALATELDLVFDTDPTPADIELRMLRTAASHEFPFAPHAFDVPWCFATRNRLGQWNSIGPRTPQSFDEAGADWIECSERERLYIEHASRWTADGRDAVAAIFRTKAENHRLRRLLEQDDAANAPRPGTIEGIVGRSPQIRELDAIISRIARRDVAVCILGESGTGKELVARAIHRQSSRRQKLFTAVNCAALPENLIESELFGHVRGAFTGADRDRAGLIETTDGGTLFLDEIGELPLTAQAKLLRFLQEGEFRRVGETANRSADVRIVSATNRRLDAAVEEGRFRDDLYYRVRGVEVLLPPLRERGADIHLLAQHFLAAERDKHRAGPALLSPDVEAIFGAYGWPGNVRELQNTIRAAHAMAGDAKEIDVAHLPERLRAVIPSRTVAGSYQDAVTRFKRDLIERSLLDAKGNQNRAAAALKMSRQALAYQIRELGILVRA